MDETFKAYKIHQIKEMHGKYESMRGLKYMAMRVMRYMRGFRGMIPLGGVKNTRERSSITSSGFHKFWTPTPPELSRSSQVLTPP